MNGGLYTVTSSVKSATVLQVGPKRPSGPRCFFTQHLVILGGEHIIRIVLHVRRIGALIFRARMKARFLGGTLRSRPERSEEAADYKGAE